MNTVCGDVKLENVGIHSQYICIYCIKMVQMRGSHLQLKVLLMILYIASTNTCTSVYKIEW